MQLRNRITDRSIVRSKPFLDREASAQAKRDIDHFLDGKIEEWNNTVPYARHFEGKEVHQPYYRRSLIEHSWRIRLMRSAQSNALHKITKLHAQAAKLYAAYQDEEMLHDTLFMQDAERIGVSQEEIYASEPSFATRLLAGYLYFVAEHERPLGVICYSYLVEYTTQKITPKQIKAMAESIGREKITGQAAHLNTDLVEDHTQDMWNILSLLIDDEQDLADVKRYLAEIQDLLKMFFEDMYVRYGQPEKQVA
ncbi:iron-containing redox enzyme family protein [Trinickia acidisoli]|uniref:iron-containing redox enzyme family protein n=1 Tax=Trinickia acidisoli TaxID=2767482 RepID=UPI001A8EA8F7|nr:iron-containing redox enzyme family protein [Trinickia acidisoli]